jgi:putative ABC transport system permease protein
MRNPLWSKIVRDLWNNKTRTIIVVISIAVGVFAVGMMATSQIILTRNMNDTFLAINPSSARLDTDPFDEDLLDAVRRLDEIQAAEGRYRLNVRVQLKDGAWRNLQLYAIPDYDDMRINKVVPDSGAWPPPRNAMLIERAAMGMLGAQEGDRLLVETPSGKQRELPVAGVAHDLFQWPANFGIVAYGYITFDTLEWLGEPRLYNELYIVTTHDRFDKEHVRRITALVRDKRVENNGHTVVLANIREPGKHNAYDLIQSMTLMLGILGVFSLLLSGFLVVNTMSALLAQQVRQIGIMKAVGAQTRQVMRVYLSMVAVFSLLALTISIPLGIVGARFFSGFVLNLFNFDLVNFAVPFEAILAQVAVGLLIPLLAALHPVISGTRVTVREAINDYGFSNRSFGHSRIDRLVQRLRTLPFPVMISLRNTFRRKGRLMLTLTTLTLAGAMLIAVLNVRTSLFRTLDDLMTYWQYDIDVTFNREYQADRVMLEALRVPGVVHVESWGGKNAFRVRPDGSENENVTVIAPPHETRLIDPIIGEGRWLLPEDANAVVVNTAFLRAEPDVKIGDDLTFKIEGREIRVRVVGSVTGQVAVMGPIAYMNHAFYTRAIRDVGDTNRIVIETAQHDPAFQRQVRARLEEHFRAIDLSVRTMDTNAEIRSGMEGIFTMFVAVTVVMAVLLALVGGLGLMGLMSLNVLERTREIGILRAVGASNGSVLQIVMAEGILIGLLSWGLGIALAFPFSKLFAEAIGVGFLNRSLSFTFSPDGVLIWLVAIIVLSALASFLPAWNASRLTVREVLAYE